MTIHSPAAPSNWRNRVGPLSVLALLIGLAIAGLLGYGLLHGPGSDAQTDSGPEAAAGAAEASPAAEAPVAPETTHLHAPALWGLGIVPFCALIGAIAILPLLPLTRHWWESNLNRLSVALLFAGLALAYMLLTEGLDGAAHALEHSLLAEYVPFIVLLFSLYVISGGIQLSGDLPAHPGTNTAFLAAGAGMASFVGTTGASMLLIRPLLATNAERRHVTHTVVFFIFLVSNVGGCLLPIGDPPLFLGYLRGVEFWWTLALWREWAACCAVLLIIYYCWDTIQYRREPATAIRRDETQRQPLRLTGAINLLWLLGVVLAVALLVPGKPVPLLGVAAFPFLRELVMLGLVGLSLRTTPAGVRQANRFNYAAILEVAALFVGIFITMHVPIAVLHAHGESLGLHTPAHFFWSTGTLSSFLDNAPTYIVFFEVANAMTDAPGPGVIRLLNGSHMRHDLLVAISLGSVFMGAMTYIGNGPNFMVKSIAEQAGIAMPSFFGFLVKYSIPLLIPVFLVITLLFLK